LGAASTLGVVSSGGPPRPLAQSPLYVATSGANIGDCTNQAQPCLTIGYALLEVWIAGASDRSDAPPTS